MVVFIIRQLLRRDRHRKLSEKKYTTVLVFVDLGVIESFYLISTWQTASSIIEQP